MAGQGSMSEGAPEERERLCQEQSTKRAEGWSMSEERLEERKCHLKKKREQANAKSMQEPPEEKELCLKNAMERAYAKMMQETPEEKELCLKNARGKHKPRGHKRHQGKRNFISRMQG